MVFDFLTPVNKEIKLYLSSLPPQYMGNKIKVYDEDETPDLDKVKIVIIGVLENRGNTSACSAVDLTELRKEFYSLCPGNWNVTIADLGDILAGDSVEDTYFAVKTVVSYLLRKNILPILIGGSQDLTYPAYRAYDDLDQMVNLASIDSHFDFGKESDEITSTSYLTKIVMDEPNNLFNFCNIGYQTYFNPQEEIDLVEKLFFDAHRLGDVTHNISFSEHLLRDADIVSLDLNSIKSSDSGNFNQFRPNGFNGREICALARYAGISDKVSFFGLFNHNNTKEEFILISQILWYFIEGYHYRTNEYPFGSKELYLKFIVPVEKEDLIFYKSNKTERWWIEIPFVENNKLNRRALLPCSYEEYLTACNQELPERWWKAQRRNVV